MQMCPRFVSDCRRYLPSRVREKRSISTCVPSQKSGGRNNVAFVGQRNDEARLKRKAKSDWNTLVYVRLSSSVLFSPLSDSATVLAAVVSAPFIFCITISGICTCACASVNSYRIKKKKKEKGIKNAPSEVIGEQKYNVIFKREISATSIVFRALRFSKTRISKLVDLQTWTWRSSLTTKGRGSCDERRFPRRGKRQGKSKRMRK